MPTMVSLTASTFMMASSTASTTASNSGSSCASGIARTVENLRVALAAAGEDAIGQASLNNSINQVLVDLDRGLDKVVQVRASIGARLNAIDTERNVNADMELLISENISSLENADLAEVVTLLNQQLASLEAAQLSFARLQNLSLFNFLS